MKQAFKLFPFLQIICIGCLIQLAVGCANIVPPAGGPKDTLAPYLIAAKPKDSATNVQPKEILIGFNEYITSADIQSNLIISPTIKTTPLVDVRLNALRIRINDSLAPNTTYSLQFGNAIKDVNEGNIAKNFTYVFSTGNQIDTGKIVGYVHLAETGAVDSTLIVVLHPAGNDTAIFKNKPLYYTKLNGKGRFEFKFLPYSRFQLFVLPNDYVKKYDDSTKLFAFADNTIAVDTKIDTLQLFAFQAYKRTEKKKSTTIAAKKTINTGLRFNKSIEGNDQDILTPVKLSFDTKIKLNDSFPILLTDTLNKVIEDATIQIDSTSQILSIQRGWNHDEKYRLILPQKSISDSLHNVLVKTDTIKFTIKPATAYGTVLIRTNGFQQFNHPVLLLTQDDKIKYSYPITQPIIRIPLILPGDFVLKILEDENNNGVWDTGVYGQQKRQPEKIRLLGTSISIKADWENEFNIILKK
jgi:Bacterial Ig-like domain